MIITLSKISVSLNQMIVGLDGLASQLETLFLKTMSNLEIDNYKKETMSVDRIQKPKASFDKEEPEKSFSFFQGETERGKKINEILNGGGYAIISTLILIFALFADDVRQIFFPVGADLTFSILTLICMLYYLVEVVILSLFQKDYFLGYYFWLDLVSTLTMAFDLIWITQYLTGGGQNAASISQISRASKAARLGTRTVKLIRLIRMVKLLKQMKLVSKDLVKQQKEEPPKKISQRLSSIHSKIGSLRNMDRINSIRHEEKLPSKRWSLIKGIDFIGPIPAPVPVSKNIISISCIPGNQPDYIIDRDQHEESRKSVTSKKVETTKKITVEHKQQISETNKKVSVPIFQETREEAKVGYGQEDKEEKKVELNIKTKRAKQEGWDRKHSSHDIIGSDVEIMVPPESKVGAKVQQQVQKNVISMIILILLSIPLLDGSTWFSNLTIYDKAETSLIYFANNYPTQYQRNADLFIASARTNFSKPLLYFSISSGTISDSFPDNYPNYAGTVNEILLNTRSDDINLVSGDGYTFAYDISGYNKKTAYFNIGRTIFVTLLIIITTIFFSSDLEFTAIAPLEDMMDTVRKIAIHPLNAIREIEERNLCLEQIQEEEEKQQTTQPKILQNTIVKIGSLLAVGFGEAGTEIICKVIEDPSIINVMIPGKKIMALFGFCDIRNFTDATQILEADVMLFVNEIAAICHKEVYEHLGSPNKNIGDAFLLVWKYNQQDVKVIQKENEDLLELIPSNRVSNIADLAVLAFVKMVGEIARSQTLQKYKNNKLLQQRIPNYTGVKMGFGLHFGWSIEGPIGSEYKIDASYLGPDVHMASRLEAATKGYGTTMLITDSVYNLMTSNRKYLRHIDRVLPEGDTKPMDLYTVDLDYMHLFEQMGVKKEQKIGAKQKKVAKVTQSLKRKKLIESIVEEGVTNEMWNHQDIKIMQQVFTRKFYQEWEIGFQQYLQGDWENALPQLTLANSLGPNGTDGPTQSLIKFIENHKGKAPIEWKGYRGFD